MSHDFVPASEASTVCPHCARRVNPKDPWCWRCNKKVVPSKDEKTLLKHCRQGLRSLWDWLSPNCAPSWEAESREANLNRLERQNQ